MFKLLIPPFPFFLILPLSPPFFPLQAVRPVIFSPFPFSLIWCFNRWINDCFYSELLGLGETERERERLNKIQSEITDSLWAKQCAVIWAESIYILNRANILLSTSALLFSSHLSSPSSSSITLSLTIFSAFQPVRPRMFHLWPAGQIRPVNHFYTLCWYMRALCVLNSAGVN